MTSPSSFLHRRPRARPAGETLLSPPISPNSPQCTLPSLRTLSKASTFHVPSSPPSDDDPVLSIPHLPQRCSTASRTLLAHMLGKEDEVVDSIAKFDRQFSGKQTGSDADQRSQTSSTRLDVDKVPKANHEHLSDSGLGTSISSKASRRPDHLNATAAQLLLVGLESSASKTENSSVKTAFDAEEKDAGRNKKVNNRQQAIHSDAADALVASSALTHSIAPSTVAVFPRSSLGSFARRKIGELIFNPILQEGSLSSFHPLVHSLQAQTRRTAIKCLRDLEKSLIFEPLRVTRSPTLYRRFGEFAVQLVLDTHLHLSESEQRRPSDRPYDNGYFLDLVQQVGRLAAQIESHRRAGSDDTMAPTADDRVTLEGGLGTTGEIAELVRWVEGKPYSLRTDQPYEPLPGFKRSGSVLSDDADRSMARRKKGEIPQEMSCSDPTCDKIFTRKCDLAKHEKTHSRPFKCPEPSCKYHDQGLPTEKERDRHINDKHSKNPVFYHCSYCPFKTKRDSNCKQHMEKKHGWRYDRVKGNGKPKAAMTPQTTPQTPSVSTPVSVAYSSVHGSTAPNSALPTPVEQPLDNFNSYHLEPTTPVHLGGTLFNNIPRNAAIGAGAYVSPIEQPYIASTPYSAISNITEQGPINDFDMYGDGDGEQQFQTNPNAMLMGPPMTPDYLAKDVNAFMQMPMTPSSASINLPNNVNEPTFSFAAPISPPSHDGLAQTISPDFPLQDDFADFTAPALHNSQFSYEPMTHEHGADIPMNDFSLFSGDPAFNNFGMVEPDPFDAFVDLGGDDY